MQAIAVYGRLRVEADGRIFVGNLFNTGVRDNFCVTEKNKKRF